jgi:hypothetical protein
MYFVRTVCELMRLKRETGPPAKMQEEMLRVLAVFLDGLEIIVTGAESKDAQVRPLGVFSLSGDASADAEGSDMSRES